MSSKKGEPKDSTAENQTSFQLEQDLLKKSKETNKRKKPKWITTTIAEEGFGRRELLAATFREFLIYMLCLILISTYVFGRLSPGKYYLTSALRERLANDETFEMIELGDINIYTYLRNTFIGEGLFRHEEVLERIEKNYTGIYILNENKLLGVPRIRQVKVKNDSCEIHGYFRRLFSVCYNKFSYENEDKESFGIKEGTEFVYQTPEDTQAITHYGIRALYSAGGFYTDLSVNTSESWEKIDFLQDNAWITPGTRAIFINFAVYNANLNLFCICKIIFELLPTGGVTPSSDFKTATIIFGQTTWHFVLRCILYAFCALLLFYVCEEIREIIYFKWNYLLQFWNYIDLSILCLGFLYVFIVEYLRYIVPFYINKVKDNPKHYGNFEYIGQLVNMLEISGAILAFFIYIKIFKFMNFNRRMAQLNNTLKQCAKDIAGFSVMFFIAFLAYAELGYLVFGSQIKDFSNFGSAMFTLLRTILGDFDYREIHEANWLVAPVYFLTYMILVFFVLLNMFLAIINDTYVDVKTDIAIAPKEMQMTDYLKSKFFNCLKIFGCKLKKESEKEKEFYSTINKIQDALKKFGFNDREIQMYFTRYEIDNLNELSKDDIQTFFDRLQREEDEKQDGKGGNVTLEDFLKQDEKLNELENSLVVLAEKVQDLLRSIEKVSN